MPSRSCFGHTVGDAKFSVLIGKANESHDAVRTVRVWARQPEASLDTHPAGQKGTNQIADGISRAGGNYARLKRMAINTAWPGPATRRTGKFVAYQHIDCILEYCLF